MSLSVVMPRERLDPLLPFGARFTEAVTEHSTLTLSVAGVPQVLTHIASSLASGDFWGATASPLLGFNLDAWWSAAGADASGNQFSRAWLVSTDVDPGVLAQDGFESDLPTLRGVEPVTVTKGAISGERSLLMDTDDILSQDRVAFHLARDPGKSMLRFNTREQFWDTEGHPLATLLVRVGVVGGRKISVFHLPDSRVKGKEPNDPPPVAADEVPLTESGNDVIVSFELSADGSDCDDVDCGPNIMPTLVDDLRIE